MQLISAIRDFYNQWALVLVFSIGFFCFYWMRPRFGSMASAFLFSTCISGIWVWAFKDNRYVTINPYDQMAIRYFSADSMAKMLAVCVPMMILAEKKMSLYFWGVIATGIFFLINSFWITAQVLGGCYGVENACGGLVGNPSISVGFTICTLPILVSSWRRQWYVVLLAAFLVFASRSSVAVGIFAAYSCLWFFPWKEFVSGHSIFSLNVLRVPVIALITMGTANAYLGSSLFNDSDRFKLWEHMIYWWSSPNNLLFGTGFGTYPVFSIHLQNAHGLFQGWWWNTMHNDPLEMIFNCGIVGFILMTLTYFTALFRAIRFDSQIAMCIFLFGLYMFLDPALHSPFPCLFAAWLFTIALRQDHTSEEIL